MSRIDWKEKLSRRDFGRVTLGVAGAALGAPLIARTAGAGHHETQAEGAPELVTDVASNATLLGQVKYVAVSEKEGQHCANCALLLQNNGDYGKCGLFQQGQVHTTGWCTSWIQKPGA